MVEGAAEQSGGIILRAHPPAQASTAKDKSYIFLPRAPLSGVSSALEPLCFLEADTMLRVQIASGERQGCVPVRSWVHITG